jgi:hypothetical protein
VTSTNRISAYALEIRYGNTKKATHLVILIIGNFLRRLVTQKIYRTKFEPKKRPEEISRPSVLIYQSQVNSSCYADVSLSPLWERARVRGMSGVSEEMGE